MLAYATLASGYCLLLPYLLNIRESYDTRLPFYHVISIYGLAILFICMTSGLL